MKKAILALSVIAALIAAILVFSSRFTMTDDLYVEWQADKVSIRGKGSGGLKWQSKRGMLTLSSSKEASRNLKIHLSGECADGQLEFNAGNRVEVILEGLKLSNPNGAALVFKGNEKTVITLKDSTFNELGDAGIEAKGDLAITGNGSLRIESTGTGHKGIDIGGDLEVTGNPTITVTTIGQPLTMVKLDPPKDAPGFNGNPDNGMPPLPPGFAKYDYSGTTKAIKAKGDIHINGGILNLRTATPGAEGLEAKGFLYFDGGILNVEAYDDAINVGMAMTVTDGKICATSTHCDGIDINGGSLKQGAIPAKGWDAQRARELETEPVYVQIGGKVRACTTAGPPEEGLDTDEHEISHTDGELIIEP